MNPSPASSVPEQTSHARDKVATAAIREVVVHWEKRRLVYNGILLVPGMLIIAKVFLLGDFAGMDVVTTMAGIVIWVGIFAVMANVCFTLGPYLELVLNILGYRLTGIKIRPFVFMMGLLWSGFVMFVVWLLLETGATI